MGGRQSQQIEKPKTSDIGQMQDTTIESQMQHAGQLVKDPTHCSSCKVAVTRSEWPRSDTCDDISLCTECATKAANTRRTKCAQHVSTVVAFRVYERTLQNCNKHDSLLDTCSQRQCRKCKINPLNLWSWVRCNDCTDYDLCLHCWAYNKHSQGENKAHTFTNMSNRYRTFITPSCAMLCKEEDTLDTVQSAGVNMAALKFDTRFDRAYCTSACEQTSTGSRMHTTWSGDWAGNSSEAVGYYCPAGWRRFALVVEGVDFENSATLYHGTSAEAVAHIFKKGLRVNMYAHWFDSAAYVSPSIIYCSHPRYAKITKMQLANDKYNYVQFVMELRVNLNAVHARHERETMGVGITEIIDPNFPQNDGLEVILPKHPAGSFLTRESGVHVTGVMVRVLDHDPMEDPESWWWTRWRSADNLRQNYYTEKKQQL